MSKVDKPINNNNYAKKAKKKFKVDASVGWADRWL